MYRDGVIFWITRSNDLVYYIEIVLPLLPQKNQMCTQEVRAIALYPPFSNRIHEYIRFQPRWENLLCERCRLSVVSKLRPFVLFSLDPVYSHRSLFHSFSLILSSFRSTGFANLFQNLSGRWSRVRRPTKWWKNVFESHFTDLGSSDKLFNSF